MSFEDKIKEIEEEIRKTPYNKATQHHIGKLKAKLARLREDQQKRGTKSKGKLGYSLKKSGDATVALVGFPSVGKSTLLNMITNADSETGVYDFTTVNVIPGVMEYKGAKFQVVDVPGLIRGASEGRGRGREVLSVVRSADLIIMLIDVFNLQQLDVIKNELYNAGLRLDQGPPHVLIKKRDSGGIEINSTVNLSLDEGTIKAVLNEYRIHNADVVVREDITVDQIIDVALGNRVYIPALVVLNKIDLVKEDYLEEVSKKTKDFVSISAEEGYNIERLKEAIFNKLDFIRIYMKPQGKEADLEEPLVVLKGSRVREVCNRLHKDFEKKFRFARVWGRSAKFEGQKVGINHGLEDSDILSIITEK
ncbi:MAG: OBG GTPase family GTP-binding protein [Candidatus Hydrothermarchaeales archaeon]